jgi:predicted ribosomally synthesized peptide with nif11-like leader
MSEEQLKAFIAKAKDDQSIQDKLKAAKSPEEVVDIAKEYGHEFTADKITELSEEELEAIAGGSQLGPNTSCAQCIKMISN